MREDRKNAFPHVGGYSTVKVLAGKRGSLRLKLVYQRTYADTVGLNEDSTFKVKSAPPSRRRPLPKWNG